MTNTDLKELSRLEVENARLKAEQDAYVAEKRILSTMTAAFRRLSSHLNTDHVLYELSEMILSEGEAAQVVCLIVRDAQNAELEFAYSKPEPAAEIIRDLERVYISTYNASPGSLIEQLVSGRSAIQSPSQLAGTRFELLADLWPDESVALIPMLQSGLTGLLIIHNPPGEAFRLEQIQIFEAIAEAGSVCIANASKHTQIVDSLAGSVEELYILQQVDAELNNTIELHYVFEIIIDWALRFTNASSAGLGLYDSNTDTMSVAAQYGFRAGALETGQVLTQLDGGITVRVARQARYEIVPDVSMDRDYYSVNDTTRSQLSVPVLRDGEVIAVISLESNKLNGFTDAHLNFVQNLGQRAGVALDNARLFTQTRLEQEKLHNILSNIADIVIVVGPDQRILLISQSALTALRLPLDVDYTGQHFLDLVQSPAMRQLFQRAAAEKDSVSLELQLDQDQIYHANIDPHRGIGWIIVMQDITHFKRMDKLKDELVATVSHDLKQPLSVMRGYLDLLQMTNQFDQRSQHYVSNLYQAFHNMRQLIDDLLDLARIESGFELAFDHVNLRALVLDCIDTSMNLAVEKNIEITPNLPDTMPLIMADKQRLQQIFHNLISNAIKYTQNGGTVRVDGDIRQNSIRINVSDNGMGISAEDQRRIFERFYRVHRPETQQIEGTGLGLAIVKTIVEAHRGHIDVKSTIGEGTSFRVTLPRE